MLIVPTHGGRTQRRLYRSLSQGLPDDLTQKLASLLAAEFSKKGAGGPPGCDPLGAPAGTCACP